MEPATAPMLARLERELPRGGYLYEPKWDGFRSLAARDGDDIDLRSRNQRPLARYFPELVAALRGLPTASFVLDGEIMARAEGRPDFTALLEQLLATAEPPLVLTPLTEDPDAAERWLDAPPGAGIDGVVAKHEDLRYEEGARRMIKVKRQRTADCVVAGFRWLVDKALPSSLLLGLYDAGELRHVGIASSFTAAARARVLEELAPHVVPLAGHPWEHGFLLGGSPIGRLPGAAGRWTPGEMEQDWVPVAPELVCEVQFDQLDDHRFRHPARFRRWRPDRDPRSCTLDQL